MSEDEVIALCKILLESRAFRKDELKQLTDKLLLQVMPSDRKVIERLIGNEYLNYVPLKHNQKLLSPLWELSQ